MNNDPVPEGVVRELIWRRKLSPRDAARLRAWLADHPEARAEFDVERALTEALGHLPAADVPSNFTARVLEAARLESAPEQRVGRWRWWHWHPRWLTRAAAVAVVLGTAAISLEQVHRAHQRAEMARRLSEVVEVARPEILENFDTIRRLSNPVPDDQLLSVMQ